MYLNSLPALNTVNMARKKIVYKELKIQLSLNGIHEPKQMSLFLYFLLP